MGLFDKLKMKLAEAAATNLSRKAERGDLGVVIQAVYVKTLGKKTFIGMLLSLFTLAVAQFAPPWADSYVRFAGMASGVLMAIGLLDRARRAQPVFEPWFLEAFAVVTEYITALSAAVLAFAASGGFSLVLKTPGLDDKMILVATALGSATAFIGRLAKASAVIPVLPQPGAANK